MFLKLGLGLSSGGNRWSPTSLFALSEPGGWYDPSDITTLFQDDAGATPVTAAGQTVGRILDKSGRGNHLTQSTLANRPTYGVEPMGGRRNLFTYSEQFDNAAWGKDACTITANSSSSPDGTTTADKVVSNNATAQMGVGQIFTASATTYTASFYVKAAEVQFVQLLWTTARSTQYANFNLSSGTVTQSTGTASILDAGNGWYRITLTSSLSAGSGQAYCWMIGSGTAGRAASYAGNGTNGFLVWGAQLETASAATAYQRVVTQIDVTESGKASLGYLLFDGTDDWLVSPTITPGTDKAQIFAGVQKLSDAATGSIAETSSDSNANNGALGLFGPLTAGANCGLRSRGTTARDASISATAPATLVLAGYADISADVVALKLNGAAAATTATDQGTGNYLAYPLYIGRTGGASSPFNGRLYSLIVRFGNNLGAATIANAESWVNSKTGAY